MPNPLREAASAPAREKSLRRTGASEKPRAPVPLDDAAQLRYAALREWRFEVARPQPLRLTYSTQSGRSSLDTDRF